MNMNHMNMAWGDAANIKDFTENTPENKKKDARKTSRILLAAFQYTHNYIQGLKRQNAYDAASIIYSDVNLIRSGNKVKFVDAEENEVEIKVGTTYYIDYGNNFHGELSYFHHGLYIGKSHEKVLIVPMRSGTDIIDISYHPTENPNGQKYYRKALQSEGFLKDCVLLINNTRYISPGRIAKEFVDISPKALKEIKEQVFSVMFCDIEQRYKQIQQNNKNYKKVIRNKNKELKRQEEKYFKLEKKYDELVEKYSKLEQNAH